MPRNFNDINEALEHIAQQFADVRGEALAARVIATFAMDRIISQSSEKEETIKNLAGDIDASLNNLQFPTGGDADLNEKVREIARLRAQQALDAIRRRQKL